MQKIKHGRYLPTSYYFVITLEILLRVSFGRYFTLTVLSFKLSNLGLELGLVLKAVANGDHVLTERPDFFPCLRTHRGSFMMICYSKQIKIRRYILISQGTTNNKPIHHLNSLMNSTAGYRPSPKIYRKNDFLLNKWFRRNKRPWLI